MKRRRGKGGEEVKGWREKKREGVLFSRYVGLPGTIARNGNP